MNGVHFACLGDRRCVGSSIFFQVQPRPLQFAGLSVVPMSSVAGVRGPYTCRPQRLLFLWPGDDDDNDDEYSGT